MNEIGRARRRGDEYRVYEDGTVEVYTLGGFLFHYSFKKDNPAEYLEQIRKGAEEDYRRDVAVHNIKQFAAQEFPGVRVEVSFD